MEERKKKPNPNPKLTASPISLLFFGWVRKIFWKNFKHGLTEDDLYDTLEENKTKKLGDDLEKNWNAELLRAQSVGREPRLLTAVFKTFWVPFMINGVIATVENLIFRIIQPVLIGKLIEYFAGPEHIERNEAYIYAAGIFVLSFASCLCYRHYVLLMNALGMRIRIACCVLIYRKILRHSRYTMGHSETGKVLNLISNDVSRFDAGMMYIHWLWLAFVQMLLVTYFLWLYAGFSALFGFIYLFLATVPMQAYIGKIMPQLRKKIAAFTDERMKMINELVSGIQVIKMYAWEIPFANLVLQVRKREISTITKAAYLKSLVLASIFFTDRTSLFITLLAYSLLKNPVMPHMVFAMGQFYYLLAIALGYFYPWAVSFTGEIFVSLERITNFLKAEESKVPPIEDYMGESKKISSIGRVEVSSGCASWTTTKHTLKDINIIIEPRTFCGIIGPVGSGKSSLLSALLGELPLTSGVLSVTGKLSYYSQEPWIFVGTVRQNILFGQRYDPVRYHKVLRVCALQQDIEIFPQGDRTLVGARGITLSGGQRARINLARTVYQEADIYLLDDPLSAVDASVGKSIFENCIRGFLKGKTCILVTHQLHFLEEAHLFIMHEGRIAAQGSHKELMTSDNNFVNLLGDDEEDQEAEKIQKTRHRQSVPAITKPVEDEEFLEPVELTSSWNIIKQYLEAIGGPCVIGMIFIILLITHVIITGTDYWVKYWSDRKVQEIIDSDEESGTGTLKGTYFGIYGGLILAVIILSVLEVAFCIKMCIKASGKLHDSMFESVLKSPMRFFHTNPLGRILNRFSKDTGLTDEAVPFHVFSCVQVALLVAGILVLLAITNYYIIIFTLIFGAMVWWTGAAFLSLAKFIRRLEGIKRSPIYSHVTDTLNGLATIRASQAQNIVNEEFNHYQDLHTAAWSLILSVNGGLGLWVDFMCVFFIVVVTSSFIITDKENVNGATFGLAVTQLLLLVGMIQYGILQLAETVSHSVSVERVLQYSKLEPEPDLESSTDRKPPDTWPENGEIQFCNVVLQYGKNHPPVLKNLNFIIEKHQKIGVVGRTGAGKSSLLAALFHLANIEGSIIIDNIDTSTIGLHDLRKRISIIPQEPVLFTASMRYNLDPFGDFPDDVLWTALEEVELKPLVESLDWKITAGGNNLSLGQRQLVCLARAILRQSRILVLDETTANVDPETDDLIQKTIRRKFVDCTILTIAHRLNTIMDSDKVLVMDGGRMVEFDHPHILLQNKSSHLYKLVEKCSRSMADQLKTMAYQAFLLKYDLEGEERARPDSFTQNSKTPNQL